MFNLPHKTHCNLLPKIAVTQSIECTIITRNIKFICSALQSSNVSLQHLINIPIQVTQYNRMNHFGFTRHLLLSWFYWFQRNYLGYFINPVYWKNMSSAEKGRKTCVLCGFTFSQIHQNDRVVDNIYVFIYVFIPPHGRSVIIHEYG